MGIEFQAAGRFFRWHLWTALALWLASSAWTLAILMHALDDAADRPLLVAAATLGSILGPMTGAISREFQSCCLACSLGLLPWCGGALAIGAAIQMAVPPRGRWLGLLRIAGWLGGWLAWFAGGLLSLGHAVS